MKLFAPNRTPPRLLILLLTILVVGSASTVTFAAQTYNFQQGTAAIVSGTTDTGNHCDDCRTGVTLPFSYTLYGIGYTTVNVGANGNIQFTGDSGYVGSDALPDAHFATAIFALKTDLRTDQTGGGIFTSVSGTAPNRIFNIEWRAVLFSNTSQSVNFEVRLFEGLNRFEIIYGAISVNGSGQTVGVQKDASDFTQFESNTANTLFAGLQLIATTAPTAASVSIGGRVTVGGSGLARARVTFVDASGETRSATTDLFGYYRFEDIAAGETIILSVSAKRYVFAPQVVTALDESEEINFTTEGYVRRKF